MTKDGLPVPGMTVFARATNLLPEKGNGHQAGRRTRSSALTDGSGSFTLAVNEGDYVVSTKETAHFRRAETTLRAGVDSAVILVEEVGHDDWIDVFGIVTSSNGETLPGVRIFAIGRAGAAASTGEAGEYALTVKAREGQSPRLRFIHKDYREQRVTLRHDEIRGLGQVQLNVALDPAGELAPVNGTILGLEGEPVGGARVRFFAASINRVFQTVSNSAGTFSLPAVETAPDYQLWVRPKALYRDYVKYGLAVDGGGLDLAITLEPLRYAGLRGQMTDIDGNPIPWFTLWYRSAQPTFRQYTPVRGDGGGVFTIDRLPEGDLVFVTRSSPFFRLSGIHLSAGREENVRLTLDHGNFELAGEVLDDRGSPVPGCRVSLRWSHEEEEIFSRSTRETATDGNGYFLFSQLGPGRHTLTVEAPGFFSVQLPCHVGGGAEEIRVQLVRLGTGT